MAVSDLAEQVLIEHAKEPDVRLYAARVLGPLFHTSDLALLDAAYDELMSAGLIERSSKIVSYFGVPKHLYKPTETGLREAAKEQTA